MHRAVLSLATLLLATACADQRSATAPDRSLVPRGPSNVITVGGGPLAKGDCLRSTGKPVEVSFSFNASDGASATLTVTDNGIQGLNGTITLNGEEVVTHPMLGGNDPVNLSIPITLAASNVLVCKLEGKPGSGLSFEVR
jgi:hypothetical protein